MTRREYRADRLRRHVASEHPGAVTLLDWHLLQPSEQRLWVSRADAVDDGDSAWRPPDDHGQAQVHATA